MTSPFATDLCLADGRLTTGAEFRDDLDSPRLRVALPSRGPIRSIAREGAGPGSRFNARVRPLSRVGVRGVLVNLLKQCRSLLTKRGTALLSDPYQEPFGDIPGPLPVGFGFVRLHARKTRHGEENCFWPNRKSCRGVHGK